MTRAGETPPETVLWRARIAAGGRRRELRCTFEQVAPECYELHISLGGSPLVTETFTRTEDLFAKAEELLLALVPDSPHRRAIHAGMIRPATRH